MNILIVEDEPDIRAFLRSLLQGLAPDFNVVEAADGKEAVAILDEGRQFDCIFCDYNMPTMNGGEVFLFIKQKNIPGKFVLVSSDEPFEHREFNGHDISYVQKPNLFKPIVKIISEIRESVIRFFEIRSELLINLRLDKWDIYLPTDEGEFEKAISGGSKDFLSQLKKLSDQGKSVCYLTVKSAAEIFHFSHGKALAALKAESSTIEDQVSANEIIYRFIKLLGVTKEVQELVAAAVDRAVERVRTSKELRELVEGADQKEYISSHSTLLAHISGYLNGKLISPQEMHYEILAMAAILHDLAVENSDLAKMQRLVDIQGLKGRLSDEKIADLKNHPILAAEMSRMFLDQDHPEEVETIISQHHERPDGSGFPKGLRDRQISFLSSLFILSHEVTNLMLRDWETVDLPFIINYLSENFSGGFFDEIISQIQTGSGQKK